jgi:anti-anti-sigma factor
MNQATKTRVAPHVFVVGTKHLDAKGAQRIRSEVLPLLKAGKGVVIDLSGVDFADSIGLGALAALVLTVPPTGSVALVGCNRRLEQVLSGVSSNRLPTRYSTLIEGMDAIMSLFNHHGSDTSEALATIVAFPAIPPDVVMPDHRSSESVQVHGHVD